MQVRVLVPVTANGPDDDGDLVGLAGPTLSLSSAFIPEGPASIESRFDEVFSIPWLIKLAIEAERDGIDALVIDCMSDPGLGALREAVSIPVLGAAQTAMSMAAMLAQRFGIVTVADETAAVMNDLIELYGFRRQYVGCAPIGVPVLQIRNDLEAVKATLAEAALSLVKHREAAAVVLGCTGFVGCADAIKRALAGAGYHVPVIDPVPTAVRTAAALAELGLAHSRVSYPPFDRKKPITGFEAMLGAIPDAKVVR